MKFSKNDILVFVKGVHRRGHGLPDRRPMHPRREWLIGLFVFLIVTGVGAVVSMVTFESYKNIDSRIYAADLSTPTYNKARAETVLADFALRKDKYNRLIEGIKDMPLLDVTATTSSSTVEVLTEGGVGLND